MTLPSYTISAARASILRQLEENRLADVDRIDRRMLDAHGIRLRALLAVSEDGRTPGFFSAQWRGPSLADVLADCAAIVARAEKRRAAA